MTPSPSTACSTLDSCGRPLPRRVVNTDWLVARASRSAASRSMTGEGLDPGRYSRVRTPQPPASAAGLASTQCQGERMAHRHTYAVTTTWTGNRGAGTASYRAYGRDHDLLAEGRPALPASTDPAFRGDPERWNPELLLVAALSDCHLLSYLHLCA